MKNSVKRNGKNCILLLDDGSYFIGKGSGCFGDFLGEICFNTSITGEMRRFCLNVTAICEPL